MKTKAILISLLLLVPQIVSAQKYLISTINGQTIITSSGKFYDSGDSTGNYSNNENYTATFCSASGMLYVNFAYINLSTKDVLTIYDGPGTASPVIRTYSGGVFSGITTSSCGCLTFKFTSDTKITLSGWEGTIGVNTSNDFVMNAITLPLDGSCLQSQNNIGSTADFSEGCFASGNTVWYGFSTTGGNNTVDIVLQNATFEQVEYMLLYDFVCSPSGPTGSVAAVSCGSSASPVQFTGLTEGYYWLGVSSSTEGSFNICASESYSDVCGDYFCGPSESCLTCPFDCGPCPEAEGGPYFHPVTGIQNTYAGICMVNTCSGSYYDNGGISNSYNNIINLVYRTFCPETPFSAIQATFNLLDIDYTTNPSACNDYLIIRNGPTQNSAIIWAGCGKSLLKQYINLAGDYNKGIFKSTHPSGCLTFAFFSNASSNGYWEGWDMNLACVPSAAGPDSTYPNDCPRSVPICDDATISSQVWGPGLSSDGCGSCVTAENFTEWYKVHVLTGGILEFEVTPLGNSDMDFAIYRADSCGDIGAPLRCSYAAYQPPGKTGLSIYAGDLSEGVTGDQWVAELEINANDRFFIMVNEWNKNEPNAYTLDFKLSGGATFDCSEVLPVTFQEFYTKVNDQSIDVIWKTASETNNKFFTVERSEDAFSFEPLAIIDGAGNSNNVIRYIYSDTKPIKGIAYYRIRQTDFDGQFNFSNVIAVDFLSNDQPWLNIYPNPSSDAVYISCDAALIDSEYTIYNAAGYELESGVVTSTHFKLPANDYDEGAYYLSVKGLSRYPFMILRPSE